MLRFLNWVFDRIQPIGTRIEVPEEKSASYLLHNWKTNIDDFLIIKDTVPTISGKEKTQYLIHNISTTVSYKIEDDEINNNLVMEMIEKDVHVVTMEDYWVITQPHIFYGPPPRFHKS